MNVPASNPFLDTALAIAARGWPVFPCNPQADPPGTEAKKRRAKAPLLPKETSPGAKDGGLWLASTEPSQIRAWWQRWPRALIGVRMGRDAGVFVVDLDPKAHDADTMLRALAAFCGGVLPPCPVVRTQSGGLHLYFRYPADLPAHPAPGYLSNRGGLFAKVDAAPAEIREHVDVRGEGGYVIVPPSVLSDGNAYSWEQEPDGEVPEAPARLLDVILRRGEFARSAAAPSTPRPSAPIAATQLADEAVRKYSLAALDREIAELSSCPPGRRGHELNARAFSLGQLVGAGALSQSMAEGCLREAAQRNGLVATDGAARVDDTIARGLSAGARSPRDLSDIQRKARERAERFGGRRQSAALAMPDDGRFDIPAEAYADEFPGGAPDLSPSFPAPHSSEAPRSEAPSSHAGAGGGRETGGAGGDALDLELSRLPCTDLGNAERFLRRFGHEFLFVREWGWLTWDGRRWTHVGADRALEDRIKEAIRLIVDEAEALAVSGEDEPADTGSRKQSMLSDEVADWALTSQAAGHVNCVRGLVQSDRERTSNVFDADPMRINVLNGTLVVAKRADEPYVQIRPHDPSDLITKLAMVEYEPKATCPLFDRFLNEVQPGAAMQRFLDQWAGLSFTGDTGEQKLVFFYGKGRNGKGVYVETLKALAGSYTETVPVETFLDQGRTRRGGEATPDLAILPGVRYLTTSEPEKGAKLAEGLIKLATGGDTMKARHLNRDFFSFVPQFKLTMQGNYRPKIDGTDEGIWGRLLLIPWAVFIPPERRDPALKVKLLAEASGILNRVLNGLCDWLDHGLVLPEAVIEATAKYRADSDPLGQFLSACTRDAPGKRVQSSALHRVFCAWAKHVGEKEWSQKGLGHAMRDRGMPDVKSDVVWWLDIELTKAEHDFIDYDPPGDARGGDEPDG